MGAPDLATITPSDCLMGNLYQDLHQFTDPANPNGFRARFCFWIITEWSHGAYYLDPTNPDENPVSLRDVCRTVKQFGHTFNGRVLTGPAGNPVLERRWNDVGALYEEACIEHILQCQAEQVRYATSEGFLKIVSIDWVAAIFQNVAVDPTFDYWAERIREKFSGGSEYFERLYGGDEFGMATLADLRSLLRHGVIKNSGEIRARR